MADKVMKKILGKSPRKNPEKKEKK